MSILIKGISLPKSLFESLYVSIDNHGDVYVYRNGKRLDYVKAIEVPPHGRLIDADSLIELCNIMAEKCDGIGESIWNQFRTTVEWTPTIIEAEGEA